MKQRGKNNWSPIPEGRTIDPIAVTRQPSLVTCTTLEVEAHYRRKNCTCSKWTEIQKSRQPCTMWLASRNALDSKSGLLTLMLNFFNVLFLVKFLF